MSTEVALVGCGALKASHPAQARHLYTGALFRLSLEYAEQSFEHVFIVSAFHELVGLDDELTPYDRDLAKLSKKLREAWGCRVIGHLSSRFQSPRLILLMGQVYAGPLVGEAILRGWPRPIEPLQGMSIGHRLSWLKDSSTHQKGLHEQRCPVQALPTRADQEAAGKERQLTFLR